MSWRFQASCQANITCACGSSVGVGADVGVLVGAGVNVGVGADVGVLVGAGVKVGMGVIVGDADMGAPAGAPQAVKSNATSVRLIIRDSNFWRFIVLILSSP